MSFLIRARSEADAVTKTLKAIVEHGTKRGDKIELLNCLLSIPYREAAWHNYESLQPEFTRLSDALGLNGWRRATRVYTDKKDRPTKPSYLARLTAYPDRHRRSGQSDRGINQIDSIVHRLASKPGYSLLSFVFLRPADLYDQFRAGYVPCPISGDFKFRDSRLHLNVMFRTCDALSVGFADIYYLRTLQIGVLADAQRATKRDDLRQGIPGDLNLFFGRVFIPARIKPAMSSPLRGQEAAERVIFLLSSG